MKKVFLLRFYGLLVGLVSSIYGLKLILNPEILGQYKTYEIIGGFFSSPIFAYSFLLFGLLKIFGVVINNRAIKIVSIFGLLFLWTLFCVSFFIVDIYCEFSTSLGILCLFPVSISARVALSEV